MAKKREIVIMAVSDDIFELPTAVFDNVQQVARWAGCPIEIALQLVNHETDLTGYRFVKVDLLRTRGKNKGGCVKKSKKIKNF
ncbi:MAG: hypothetical protein IJ301_01505 [Clostridia bacterium]|nr:hypothetical protein [Clostridia bacterium]